MASVRKREWIYQGEPKTAWICDYVDGSGKRRQKTFEKKKDADRFRDKVQGEIERGEHVPDREGMTVKKCAEYFIRHAEGRKNDGKIGESRLRIIKCALDNHIIPELGKTRLDQLSWPILEEWARKMSMVNKLSARTRESYLTVLKMMEDFAIKRGYVKKPIVRDFRRDAGSAKVAPIRTFTAEQAALLLATANERQPGRKKRTFAMRRCAVNLAGFCGLRFGEIMGITLESLDFDRRVLRIRHNLTAWDELKGPKTASGRRDVPMPVHIAGLLKDWLELHYLPGDRGLLFRTESGGPFGQGNFKTHCWYPLLRQAGLWDEGGDQFHFHALRHFAASCMIEHGLSLPDVAALLGHSKFDMTLQIYAHPIVGGHRRHEAFERMSGALLTAAAAASSG